MNAQRAIGTLLLCLILATGACARNTEDQLATNDMDTTLVDNPATVDEVAPSPSEPPASTPPKSATKPPTSTPATPASSSRTVSLPAGATFDVAMTTPINTETSNVGDRIEGKLTTALSSPDGGGALIAEQGASVWGEITELRRASRAKSEEERAMVKMQFTSI